MRGMLKIRAATVILPLLATACAYKEPVLEPEEITAEAEDLDLLNAHAPFPGVLTCGQPTREQFVELSKSGYRTFINMRMLDEEGTGWERKLSGGLGVRYYSIPMKGAEGLTEENAHLLAEALDESRGAVVAYCKSGNRAGALFALKAYYVDDKSAKKALAIGKSAGVTKLEPALREALGLEAE
jgi:protein tyrosine phosphatase (PTP) superfamily phosphohydrolase (DUF442 family)